MYTYEKLIEGTVAYIKRNGRDQAVIDKLETMLPPAWAMEIIAEALDLTDETPEKP